jgi:hypothetical protein
MTPWQCIIIISLAGGFGGLANAFMSGEGIALPHLEKEIWCPGFIGNSFVGTLAALVSWGLYGSGSGVELARMVAADNPRAEVSLTIGAIAGAVLVGIGGAKWLSNEVDKKFLQVAASKAGEREIPPEDCKTMAKSSPRKALAIVEKYTPLEEAHR